MERPAKHKAFKVNMIAVSFRSHLLTESMTESMTDVVTDVVTDKKKPLETNLGETVSINFP